MCRNVFKREDSHRDREREKEIQTIIEVQGREREIQTIIEVQGIGREIQTILNVRERE